MKTMLRSCTGTSLQGFRRLFCIAAALSAATLADPLVEAASNAGWFGAGNYTDHSNADVVPALVCSLALGLLYVFGRAQLFTAPRTPTLKPMGLVPAIFALQLIVLYCMETLEQVAVTGHALGGVVWLGAPVAIALALHAAASLLVTFLLARLLDGLTRIAVDIALYIREMFLRRSLRRTIAAEQTVDDFRVARKDPLASRAALRAPPILFA
jgi:hypothetical protein